MWDEGAAADDENTTELGELLPFSPQEASARSPPPEADMQSLLVRVPSLLYQADRPPMCSDQLGASPPQAGICEAEPDY